MFARACAESDLSGDPKDEEAHARLLEAIRAYAGVTGHSPRWSGAKMLARLGFPRSVIAFLGRWGSDAILKYIEEVTAVGTAMDFPRPSTCSRRR